MRTCVQVQLKFPVLLIVGRKQQQLSNVPVSPAHMHSSSVLVSQTRLHQLCFNWLTASKKVEKGLSFFTED